MLSYKEYKQLNESLYGAINLGIRSPNILSAPIGATGATEVVETETESEEENSLEEAKKTEKCKCGKMMKKKMDCDCEKDVEDEDSEDEEDAEDEDSEDEEEEDEDSEDEEESMMKKKMKKKMKNEGAVDDEIKKHVDFHREIGSDGMPNKPAKAQKASSSKNFRGGNDWQHPYSKGMKKKSKKEWSEILADFDSILEGKDESVVSQVKNNLENIKKLLEAKEMTEEEKAWWSSVNSQLGSAPGSLGFAPVGKITQAIR